MRGRQTIKSGGEFDFSAAWNYCIVLYDTVNYCLFVSTQENPVSSEIRVAYFFAAPYFD